MRLLNNQIGSKRNFLMLIVIFSIISITNILTISSVTNVVMTIPQILIVLLLAFRGNLDFAILLHLTFIMLGLSNMGTLGMFDNQAFVSYNYATLKLLGPIRFSYALSILLAFLCLTSGKKINKKTTFYKLFRTFLWMGISGLLIGLIGLLLSPYYSLDGLTGPAVYIFVVIINAFLCLNIANDNNYKIAYYLCCAAISAGILSSLICHVVFGVTSFYGGVEIVYLADIVSFAAILFIAIPYVRSGRFIFYVVLGAYAYLSMSTASGKTIFGLLFAFACLFYILFFNKQSFISQKKLRHVRLGIIIVAVLFVPRVISSFSSDSMTYYKIKAASSMFSGGEMAESPYLRVASLRNIIEKGINNPFFLVFGNGYGGYFEDELKLFAGFDLTEGGWSDEEVSTGRFTTGHDTFVTVPLYNGLIGVILIIQLFIVYMKRLKYNWMSAMSFFWFVLKFYFNTIFAVIGLFFLFASEYQLNEDERTNYLPR